QPRLQPAPAAGPAGRGDAEVRGLRPGGYRVPARRRPAGRERRPRRRQHQLPAGGDRPGERDLHRAGEFAADGRGPRGRLQPARKRDQRRLGVMALIALNKPFGVLCQFTDRSVPPRRTLAEFGLPPGVYPAGRLAHDSEGLPLLTDDGALAHRIADPRDSQPKTYLVQVEGAPAPEQLQRLREGVELNDGRTRPAQAALVEAPALWPRDPPVRWRRSVPDAWLRLTIS